MPIHAGLNRKFTCARYRFSQLFVVLLLSLPLLGCQVTNSAKEPNIETAPSETVIQIPEKETFGSGATKVALLFAMPGQGVSTTALKDIRNGAILGSKILGSKTLALTVHGPARTAERLSSLYHQEADNGARFIVLAGNYSDILSLKKKSVPTVAIAPNSLPRDLNIMAFGFDETDSLLKGFEYAGRHGHGKAVLFAPEAYGRHRMNWLTGQLGSKITISVITYRASENITKLLGRAKSQLTSADMIGFAGTDPQIPKIMAAIRAKKTAPAKAVIIGHSGWPAAFSKSAHLRGAIIARASRKNYERIASTYKEQFGKPLTFEAASGFDMIALAAGIARKAGKKGFTKKALHSETGFRGVSGVFRFIKDGSVDRKVEIYEIKKRQFALVQSADDGF